MVRKVVVFYADDLDGSEADSTVKFDLDGREYELDLSDANAQRLRQTLAPYVAAARRVRRRVETATGPLGYPSSYSEMRRAGQERRKWLVDNGYLVNDRGRIPNELAEAYRSETPASENVSIDPALKAPA